QVHACTDICLIFKLLLPKHSYLRKRKRRAPTVEQHVALKEVHCIGLLLESRKFSSCLSNGVCGGIHDIVQEFTPTSIQA
ncbi:hypothetical protein P5673_027997, partial [Acropora cervicornis]